jgi:hypothetical protein
MFLRHPENPPDKRITPEPGTPTYALGTTLAEVYRLGRNDIRGYLGYQVVLHMLLADCCWLVKLSSVCLDAPCSKLYHHIYNIISTMCIPGYTLCTKIRLYYIASTNK